MNQIGEIIYCGGCNPQIPLAKRVGMREFQLIKYDKGRKIQMTSSYQGDGLYKIKCDTCGFGHLFAVVEETIGVNEEVTLKLG